MSTIKFASIHRDFVTALNKRVNAYLKMKGVDKHGNREMIVKTVYMFILYLIPYSFTEKLLRSSVVMHTNLHYKTSKTFLDALAGHMRLLKQLGKKPLSLSSNN